VSQHECKTCFKSFEWLGERDPKFSICIRCWRELGCPKSVEEAVDALVQKSSWLSQIVKKEIA
jgi:hypothetical protein